MALRSLITVLFLAIAARSVVIEPLVERQWAGKCTIGWNHGNTQIPGGSPATGGGANTHLQNSYAFIVGSDGKETRFPVNADSKSTAIAADGTYGGLSGGNFHIQSNNPNAANVAGCVVSFTNRKDHADETFDTSKVSKAQCDLYHKGGAFSANSGCRCRFDCQ